MSIASRSTCGCYVASRHSRATMWGFHESIKGMQKPNKVNNTALW